MERHRHRSTQAETIDPLFNRQASSVRSAKGIVAGINRPPSNVTVQGSIPSLLPIVGRILLPVPNSVRNYYRVVNLFSRVSASSRFLRLAPASPSRSPQGTVPQSAAAIQTRLRCHVAGVISFLQRWAIRSLDSNVSRIIRIKLVERFSSVDEGDRNKGSTSPTPHLRSNMREIMTTN